MPLKVLIWFDLVDVEVVWHYSADVCLGDLVVRVVGLAKILKEDDVEDLCRYFVELHGVLGVSQNLQIVSQDQRGNLPCQHFVLVRKLEELDGVKSVKLWLQLLDQPLLARFYSQVVYCRVHLIQLLKRTYGELSAV